MAILETSDLGSLSAAARTYVNWIGLNELPDGATANDMRRYAQRLGMETSHSGDLYRGIVVTLDKAAKLLDNKDFSVRAPKARPVESWSRSRIVATSFATGAQNDEHLSTTRMGVVLREKSAKVVAVIDSQTKFAITDELMDAFGGIDGMMDADFDPEILEGMDAAEDEVLVESTGSSRFNLCRSVVSVVFSAMMPEKRPDWFDRAVRPKIKRLTKADERAMSRYKDRRDKFLLFKCDNRGNLEFDGNIGYGGRQA